MIKFVLAGRRRPGDTQERYFFEWGTMHVALMLTSPSVMKAFRRYSQHYAINEVPEGALWHPRSPIGWDNFSDHWIERLEDLEASLRNADYVQRIQPHSFGDTAFTLELLTSGKTLHEAPDFRNGGVKIIYFLRRRPELDQQEFERRWSEEHGPTVVNALSKLNVLQKYVQSAQLPLDPSLFTGTLFEAGGVGQYSGVEEFWFKDLSALNKIAEHSEILNAIRESDRRIAQEEGSFSMVTTERVVWDYVSPGTSTPLAAVLQPGTLEAAVDAQGYSSWNIPPTPPQ